MASTDARFFTLTNIECESGLSARDDPKPFVQVRCETKEGHVIIGQMDVEAARQLASQFVEVAEASIHDHALYRFLVDETEAEPDLALATISALRRHRVDMVADGD